MFEDLAASRYLMTAYATASDSWENFRRTTNRASLFEVAAILCGAWTALSEDEDFLKALDAMPAMPPDVHSALAGKAPVGVPAERTKFLGEIVAYREREKLLAQELVVLVQAGMSPVHAVRLVTDLGELLRENPKPMDAVRVKRLKAGIPRLAQELCKAQQVLKALDYDAPKELEANRPPHRRWARSIRMAGLGLKATAGAAGAVANVAAAVGSFGALTGLGLVSVLAGAEAMASAVGELGEA